MNGQNREEERKALEILKTYVSMDEYAKFIISDKPDLQNPEMRTGVEVVRVFNPNEKQTSDAVHKNILHQRGESDRFFRPNVLKRFLEMSKSKLLTSAGNIIGYQTQNHIGEAESILMNSINEKAQKIQTQYTAVDSCDLFMFDKTDCAGSVCFKDRTTSIANTLFNKENLDIFFAKIFVCRRNYNLLGIIDMKQKEVSFIEF